jgi:hypothetical protein
MDNERNTENCFIESMAAATLPFPATECALIGDSLKEGENAS